MKWKELEGWRLVAIMDIQYDFGFKENNPDESHGDDVVKLIFLVRSPEGVEKKLLVSSLNKGYSWFDNWKLKEWSGETPELNDSFKMIGSRITSVEFEGKEDDDGRVHADIDKWTEAVGGGYWGPKEEENYWFITITTHLKIVRLGTQYHDCHYPDTIWDVL
jgi:hypothetical protein